MHVRTAPRRLARAAVAAVATLAVGAGLTAVPGAQARPVVENTTIEGFEPVLPTGVWTDLGRGATGVQVHQSPYGGTLAAVWTTTPPGGVSEVWARIKRGRTWHPRVRLSDPRVPATRPSADIDSDGSLLVGWAERRSGRPLLVTRTVTGGSVAARRVLDVGATDGPYVSAGHLHDAVAWVAPHNGVRRPFVSLDVGAGFGPGRSIGSTWPHHTLPGTLRVNADGAQVHVAHLGHDVARNRALAGWAVTEPTRSTTWTTVDGLGPVQQLTSTTPEVPGPAHPPLIAVDDRGRAVVVLTNQDAQDRYPRALLWTPGSGSPALRFADPVALSNPDAGANDVLRSLRNDRGRIVAAHGGAPGQLNQLLSPEQAIVGQDYDPLTSSNCADNENWFVPRVQQDNELLCTTSDEDSSTRILHAFLGVDSLVTLRPDPAVGGSVETTVPDPLVPALAVTEDVAGTQDPSWLLDHTVAGTDPAPALRRTTRLKAPTLKGRPRVGRTLRARPGTWSPSPARVTYRWYAGKKLLRKATGPRIKLRKAMRGKRVRVRIELTRAGHQPTVVTLRTKKKIRPKRR